MLLYYLNYGSRDSFSVVGALVIKYFVSGCEQGPKLSERALNRSKKYEKQNYFG